MVDRRSLYPQVWLFIVMILVIRMTLSVHWLHRFRWCFDELTLECEIAVL